MTETNNKINTTLDDKVIKEIIKTKIEKERIDAKLEQLKHKHCDNLAPGRYESKYGVIIKQVKPYSDTDWKKLLADHPEIDKAKYTTIKESNPIIIRNYMIGII